jgi:hypothetical protein
MRPSSATAIGKKSSSASRRPAPILTTPSGKYADRPIPTSPEVGFDLP